MLLMGALISGILLSPLWSQSASPSRQTGSGAKAATAPTGAAPASSAKPVTYKLGMSRREFEYYGILWGIDSLRVQAVASGELIRFTWRVIDDQKAKVLNDEKIEPYLLDPAAHAKLLVPELPFMGKMRVKSTPQTGKTYWVGFSNPGYFVKKGDRVDVAIGPFHVEGLPVE